MDELETVNLDLLNQIINENECFELEQVLEDWEKKHKEVDGTDYESKVPSLTKLQSWSSTKQEEWQNGFPVNLKRLTQNDMEHFLRATQASHNREEFNNTNTNDNFSGVGSHQIPDKFRRSDDKADKTYEDGSIADSCLFVAKDGHSVFTCSFPEFPSQRGSMITENSTQPYYDPPPYFEISPHLPDVDSKTITHGFFVQSPEIMRGSFMPRRGDLSLHSRYYNSEGGPIEDCVPGRGQTHVSISRDQLHEPILNRRQSIGQSQNESHMRHKSMLALSELLARDSNGSRKRTRSPSPPVSLKQQQLHQHQQQRQHFSISCSDTSLHSENANSLVHDGPLNKIHKSLMDSPATSGSDTTLATSPGEFSSSLEKSSISSPDQTEEAEQRGGVEWQPFKVKSWCKMYAADRTEVFITNVHLNVDKGFNFSHVDDAFVCQRKNHFQVTSTFWFSQAPKFIEADGSLIPISYFCLYFYGVKAESESHVVSIEQSESDRTKHPYLPQRINLADVRPNAAVKSVVGRLHFGETTLNNMRKRGKPNPDQRYFKLVVSLATDDSSHAEPRHFVTAYNSEKIIVRASNPNQFENDPESLWIKGKSGDSICHYGNVGINTKSPTEALSVHGNVKITGQILEPSDVRIKTNIKEMNTKEQLKNITKINMYQYRYLPSYEEYAGLKKANPKANDSNPAAVNPTVGVLAQQVSQILPDAVQVVGDVVLPDGNVVEGFLVVNKDRIFMEGLGAVKELCKVTDKLERRINKIEMKNRELTKLKDSLTKSDLGQCTNQCIEVESCDGFVPSLPTKEEQEKKRLDRKFSALEKMKTFFKKRWKKVLIVAAISLALICSIVGMTFGIKARNPPIPPPMTFTIGSTTTSQTPPPCEKVFIISDKSSSKCVLKPDETESFSIMLTGREVTCLPPATTTPPQNLSSQPPPSTTTQEGNGVESVTPANDNNFLPNDTDHISNKLTTEGPVGPTGDFSKDNNQYPLQVSTEPPQLHASTEKSEQGGGGGGYTTDADKPIRVKRKTSTEDEFRVIVGGVTLCITEVVDGNMSYSVFLANDETNDPVKVQIKSTKEVVMCHWSRTIIKDSNNFEKRGPCFGGNSEWELPAGQYYNSSFTFYLKDKSDVQATCPSLSGPSYTLSFIRKKCE